MSLGFQLIESRPLRVCLDANVWISYLGAYSVMKSGTPAALVDMIDAGHTGGISLQLFLSWELIDTIRIVLLRLGVSEVLVASFIDAIEALMRTGPEQLDPPLFLAGREQFAMRDREDAGVLGACIAGDVELLVTDNLIDFVTPDARRLNTQVVRPGTAAARQLFALIHEPIGHAPLVVMHPIDALAWLSAGQRPTAEAVRTVYGTSAVV